MQDSLSKEFSPEEWFKRADDDELSAKVIISEGGAPSTACFLSQQMGEKYLKAFLIAKKQRFPKIHPLDKLLELCIEIDNSFTGLKDDAIYLTAFYVPTRYPGDYPEFTLEQAEEALEAAKRIKDFVLSKIK